MLEIDLKSALKYFNGLNDGNINQRRLTKIDWNTNVIFSQTIRFENEPLGIIWMNLVIMPTVHIMTLL